LLNQFGEQMENRVLWPAKGWSTVRLPFEISLHPVDLFLGVSQFVPKGNQKSLGFIYDLGFLHRPESYPKSLSKLKKQTAEVAERSTQIITISTTVKNDIHEQYGYPLDKITVAYPGVDLRYSKEGAIYKTKNPYFLFIGALKPGKNIPGLLRAFAKFMQTDTKHHELLLVGGDYWLDTEIDTVIKEFSLESRVKKLGFIDDEDMPELYRGAVSFVSPSYYEGFCIPAIEAITCGCPVIGGNIGALPEVIGDSGICVKPDDIESIARAMHEMAYNAKKRGSYVQKGFIQAKKYSWDSFAGQVYRVIETI
jgi:glycosyltransferase involved in cell wall biosynthesis